MGSEVGGGGGVPGLSLKKSFFSQIFGSKQQKGVMDKLGFTGISSPST